jgi:plastocyanin
MGFSFLSPHHRRRLHYWPGTVWSRVLGYHLTGPRGNLRMHVLQARVNATVIAVSVLVAVSAASLAADTASVSQRGRKFSPDTLVITPGTAVQIANDDRVSHHIYIDQPDMKFDSGEQSVGNAVTLTFDHEGHFAVRCAIHPTMHLDVTVTAKSP